MPSTLVLNEEKSKKINYIFDELVERSTKANAEILAFADMQSCTIVGGYSNPKGMKYSEPTKEQLDILDNAENNSLFSLHTHPSKNPFSFADIVTHNIVLPIGTSIIQTIDEYQYFLFTPKGSRIVFENSKEIAEFKKAGEQAVKTIMKEKNISYSEAKHEVIKELADKMGWEYGRKKDKYRLLKNKDEKIVLHGDEEKRKFEVETDGTAMTKKEYLSYLDTLKREADR